MDKEKKTKYREDFCPEASSGKPQERALMNILEDMQKDKKLIENQRKAILNTLEDVQEAQRKLRKRYYELNVLKDLLQELGYTMKIEDIFKRMVKALKQVLPESVNISYVVSPRISGMDPGLLYVHARTPFGKKYLDLVIWNIRMSFKGLPDSLRKKKELERWIKTDFKVKFVEGELDIASESLPHSLFSSSLSVGDDMIGFINVSSEEDSLFSKKDITLVNTILGASAGAILRLSSIFESEEMRIRSLVEGLSDGILMFDESKMVTMINPAARKITGLPSPVFPFSEFSKIFKDIDLDNKADKTLEKGEVVKIGEANLNRLVYEIVVTPVRDCKGNVVGGALVLHDITHLKEVDRMKTEFVSVVSHQLRTPLTAIKLFVEMLSEGDMGKLNKGQRDYMNNIKESTERMIRLVNDLLNISRLETGRLKIEPKPVQLEDFIQGIIDEVRPVAREKDCKIVFKKPAKKMEKVPIDEVLMRQVIHNLVMNAIDYSPVYVLENRKKKAGECDIVVSLKKEPPARIGKKSKDGAILISVKDKGMGIPKEAQAGIFDKFFRAGNAYKMMPEGSGLGLYVSKMIVQASGGEIWFESREGKGTVFYVRIPLKGMIPKKGEKGIAL